MTISIRTNDTQQVKKLFSKIQMPQKESHKGQNGKVLVIGGSSLFHAASFWAAEVASHFADIVHYSSTKENNEIMKSLKKQFTDGIVIPRDQLDSYIEEDNAILLGPGMLRGEGIEAKETRDLTYRLINAHPDKQYVFDAGALQMMNPSWILKLKKQAILTPHQIEFQKLFGIPIQTKPGADKIRIVKETAAKYHAVILLKAVDDIISDGKNEYIIEGGNQGLTKGGTGDTLAGLAVSFATKESSLMAAVYASVLLKRTADELLIEKGYWYNISDIIQHVPKTLRGLTDKIL